MYNFIKKNPFTLIYNILKSTKLDSTYSYKNRIKKDQDINFPSTCVIITQYLCGDKYLITGINIPNFIILTLIIYF